MSDDDNTGGGGKKKDRVAKFADEAGAQIEEMARAAARDIADRKALATLDAVRGRGGQ